VRCGTGDGPLPPDGVTMKAGVVLSKVETARISQAVD
jgi:hypothetical protein